MGNLTCLNKQKANFNKDNKVNSELKKISLNKSFQTITTLFKKQNIISMIDLKNKSELRNNTLIKSKEFKKNIVQKLEQKLNKDPYLAPDSLSAYTLMNDIMIQSVSEIVSKYMFPLVSPTKGENISIVAVGGYGRAEMAPYSDIDLLFLTPYKQTAWGENVIETILYILWDLGLKVGHSVRNIDESLRIAKNDITARTSLLENRLIFGDVELANQLNKRLWKEVFSKSAPEFIEKKLEERNLRHQKQGAERYLLEPNIKEGKGGLRDLQTLYWISKYVYKISNKKDLIKYKIFTKDDLEIFFKAEDFLWTIRCALHIFSKRANEVLSFDLQVPLAKLLGFQKDSGLLAVENFMQQYFLHAKNIGELTRILLSKMEAIHVKKSPSLVRKIKSAISNNNLILDKGFVISNGRIDVIDNDKFLKKPLNQIKLFQNGLKSRRLIHPNSLHLISKNINNIDSNFLKNPEATKIFIDVLLNYGDPERALRRMNEVGFLGKYIPEFQNIVGMMQFNMYHKYTVDEHTIQCIKILSQIEQGFLKEDLPLASKILEDGINRKVLYLALMLHDVGKGQTQSHSILGSKIAIKVTERLGFESHEVELTSWLIKNHLLMSDISQKRDLSEEKTIRDFANIVKTTNRLRLLTVLTVCDIRGVGPEVWNNWKAVMIRTLFYKTQNMLKENFETASRPEQIENAKSALRKELKNWEKSKLENEINRHNTGFYLGLTLQTQTIFSNLSKNNEKLNVNSKVQTDTSRDATKVCFLIEDHPGIFSRLAGAIALSGANVIDARTYTTSDGYATSVFWIQSNEGKPFEENRLSKLNKTINEALKGQIIARDILKEKGKIKRKEKDFIVPTNITFDNEGSEIHTIIEIETRDRLGLLYDLARTLSDNYTSISSAIIATYGEQAVDTFYVKDLFGLKLHSQNKREILEKKIKEVIQAGTLIGPN